jgi:hypothetical protein
MSFEDNIKEWVSLDNEIKNLNEKIKSLRDNKSILSNELITHANDNNLTHKLIEITDGNLKFNDRKETSPLTFKFIKQCLTDCIVNEDSVDKIINYIKEKREIKYVSEIKRSYKK